MLDQPCEFCGLGVPAAADRCPHCGRPGLFPNVRAARESANDRALRARYDGARREAERDGLPVTEFEAALGESCAIVARRLGEVERLAASERQGYSTYYQLIDAENRLPDADAWDPLRRMADTALFPGYAAHIRFLALSLDEAGLDSYGDCFLVCRDSMIEHRASVFEANSAVFLRKTTPEEVASVLEGRRATYGERNLLCVAKLAGRLSPTTKTEEFAGVLLTAGQTSSEDDFVEVHVHGPMTINTFRKVVIRDAKLVRKRSMLKALRERLARYGVELEVRQ